MGFASLETGTNYGAVTCGSIPRRPDTQRCDERDARRVDARPTHYTMPEIVMYSLVFPDYYVELFSSQEQLLRFIQSYETDEPLIIKNAEGDKILLSKQSLKAALSKKDIKPPRRAMTYIYWEGNDEWLFRVSRHD